MDSVRRGITLITLKANWDLGTELKEEMIVQYLEQFWADPIDLFAITANRMYRPHRMRTFLEFITKKLPALSTM